MKENNGIMNVLFENVLISLICTRYKVTNFMQPTGNYKPTCWEEQNTVAQDLSHTVETLRVKGKHSQGKKIKVRLSR